MLKNNLVNIVKKFKLIEDIQKGNFGLEKENLRVDKDGKIALTPHPEKLGDKSIHPYITIDFSESQIEMITPVLKSTKDAYYFLENIHDIVSENLEDEYLWTQSNPPIIESESQIPVGQFKVKKEKQKYRESLARRYGGYVQLLTGIHYNFSFDTEFLNEFYKKIKESQECIVVDYKEFKDNIYMKVARNYMKYSWFLIYFLGASGPIHKSYDSKILKKLDKFDEETYYLKNGVSFRNSIYGYRNKEELNVSYDSLNNYINDIKKYIEKGVIQGANEYYSSIRLKPKNPKDIFNSFQNGGIEYLEIRCIDLNPFTKIGIDLRDMDFIHYFLIYMLLKEEEDFNLLISKENEKNFSTNGFNQNFFIENFNHTKEKIVSCAKGILFDMIEVFKAFGIYNKMEETFNFQLAKIDNSKNLYINRIIENVKNKGYINFHLESAKNSLDETLKNSFSLKNYEDMELSTQILIKAAIKKGIKFEIIDRNENFISLEKNGSKEYVKQATKTSKDSYISMLIMENKVVSKEILKESNIRVPIGSNYDDFKRAKKDFKKFKGKKIVIKPKSTNFGLGISIFQNEFSEIEFIEALKIAFSEDKSVLIEEFITGEEFRFLVIGNEVVGILKRVPANIEGDGVKSIKELVEVKNKNYLRGSHYEKPLQKIKLGEIESLLLQNKNKNFEYIPKKNEIIFLRENSNVSTGGDTIDFTDEIIDFYKQIAIKAAKSANATFCGVDIMIEDIKKINGNYAVIEINFNPAIHIHCYPAIGIKRQIGEKVIDVLFPEKI